MRCTSASLRWRVPPRYLPMPVPMPRRRFFGCVGFMPRSVAVARFCLPFDGCHRPSSFCISISRSRRSLAARRCPWRMDAGMRPSSRALSCCAPHPCDLDVSLESSRTRARVSLLVVVSFFFLDVFPAPGANSVVDNSCSSFLSFARCDSSSSLAGSSGSGSGSGGSRLSSSVLEDC